MKEWICREISTATRDAENGILTMETELIRCKDCKYNPENAMSYLDDDLIEGYMHCGHLGDDGYCSLAKKKE